jgi:hypothetical protein
MRFLLDNPAIILVIVALVARMLRARSKAAAKRDGAAPAGQDDERTRRVREEIQRRIAERRGLAVPPPAAQPVPAPPVVFVEPAEPPPPVSDIEAVLAEQRRLAEEVRALDRAKPAPIPVPFRAPGGTDPAGDGRPGPFPELATAAAARRAVILREVLGSPRGLSLEGCLWR